MTKRFILLCAAVLLLSGIDRLADAGYLVERRKPQFQTEPGYYVFPTPYSIPGVGEGAAAVGIAMNLFGTPTDAFGFALTGDIKGQGIGISDVHLLSRRLIFDAFTQYFDAATVTSFRKRGMETGKHDYTLMEFGSFWFTGSRLTATYSDRRFEVYGGSYSINSTLDRILDNDGSAILEIVDPQPWRTRVYALGTRLDLTDDYADPRRGVRLDASRWWSPPQSHRDPDFYNMEYNASVYVPVGRISTLVFNCFRSDAHVLRQGETDRAVISAEQGLDCAAVADPVKRLQCDQVIDGIIAANTYGTVSAFGGTSRMRAYPHERFKGAHAVFYAAEFRLNLTEEAHPFDIFIARDIRTALQVALFYELGSVADKRDELGDLYRPSYGAGFRMVTASGVVLRADVASGREGVQTTVILGYPWESF